MTIYETKKLVRDERSTPFLPPTDFSLEAEGLGADDGCLIGSIIMALQRYQLDKFTKGWFVGNFSPTLLATDAVEVAVKHYRAGEAESSHYHKIATELT